MKITLNRSNIAGLSKPGGMVDVATRRVAEQVRDEAKRIVRTEGRVDTGEMLNGIVVERLGDRRWQVQSRAPHTVFQHEGTSGSQAAPGKVLAFKPKGSRVVVFARRSRGFRGIRFLARALERIRV